MSISVLISVYQSERPEYLNRALQSVWDDQTLKPDEIVLIEDGPLTQNLLNVLDNWKKLLGDKLQLIINEQNLGVTKSLNRGLKVCRGIYIARWIPAIARCPTASKRSVTILTLIRTSLL